MLLNLLLRFYLSSNFVYYRRKRTNNSTRKRKDIRMKEIGQDNLNTYESIADFQIDNYEGKFDLMTNSALTKWTK